MSDMQYRQAYYFASDRLVNSLIDQKGLAVFMKLYESESPESGIVALYGASRDALIRRAGM